MDYSKIVKDIKVHFHLLQYESALTAKRITFLHWEFYARVRKHQIKSDEIVHFRPTPQRWAYFGNEELLQCVSFDVFALIELPVQRNAFDCETLSGVLKKEYFSERSFARFTVMKIAFAEVVEYIYVHDKVAPFDLCLNYLQIDCDLFWYFELKFIESLGIVDDPILYQGR